MIEETKEMRELRINMEYQNFFYFCLNTKLTEKEIEELKEKMRGLV